MKFLTPTKKFLKWLVLLANGRPIIDCGCGEGHVTAALDKLGAKVIGLDIRAGLIERDAEGSIPILPLDATTFNYPSDSIVLFARPCHSAWVEESIRRARRRVDVILYVGFDKNIQDDLGEFADEFKKIGKNVGKEHECLWFMKRVNSDIRPWCLVKTEYWSMPSWVEDGGQNWINLAGGRCPKSSKDVVMSRVLVDDYHTLDWTLTDLLKPDSDAGWLSPEGTFHGCDHNEHVLYADLILKDSQASLMEKGWCHVWGKRSDPYWSTNNGLTTEQRNYLRINGYPRVEEDVDDTVDTKSSVLNEVTGLAYPTNLGLRKIDRTSD